MVPAEYAQGDFGCGCGGREVVSITRLARAFRVVGVVGITIARWRDLRGTREYKDPSRHLSPLQEPGPRGEESRVNGRCAHRLWRTEGRTAELRRGLAFEEGCWKRVVLVDARFRKGTTNRSTRGI